MSQGRSALKYQDNNVKAFPVKLNPNDALTSHVSSVVRFHDKFLSNNVGKCQGRSARTCHDKSAKVFPDNNAGEFRLTAFI